MKKSLMKIILTIFVVILPMITNIMYGDSDIVFGFYENLSIMELIKKESFGVIFIILLLFFSIFKIFQNKLLKKYFSFKNSDEIVYHRELNDLISPELASVVINNKFEIKTFVMSTLLSLNVSKKILVDNKKILLCNVDNISEIESNVLALIFNKSDFNFKNGEYITFDQIKENFNKKDNMKNIKNRIKEIYNLQLNVLYEKDIYDKKIGKIIKNSRDFAIINVICLIDEFMLGLLLIICDLNYFKFFVIFHILVLILYKFFSLNVDSFKEWALSSIRDSTYHFLYLFCGSIILLIYNFNILSVLIIITLALNIYLLSFGDDEILTFNGYKEYNKLQGLKKFILDFGRMNHRNIDDVILWEKYLVYATAFGIPLKITDKIPQELLNINIAINEIEDTISIFD